MIEDFYMLHVHSLKKKKKKLYRKLGLNFASGRLKAIIRQYFRIDLGAT